MWKQGLSCHPIVFVWKQGDGLDHSHPATEDCTCGNTVQDEEHVLMDCTHTEHIRVKYNINNSDSLFDIMSMDPYTVANVITNSCLANWLNLWFNVTTTTKNKEKLSNRVWENWQKVVKPPNLTFFGPWKMTFIEWFNKIHLLAVHQHPPWEASWQNKEKVIKQFLRKLPPSGKWTKFDL